MIKQHGPYANPSERWAAETLEAALPAAEIHTNLLLIYRGNTYEVDLMVITDCEVFLIDAKGYTGRVEVKQGYVVVDDQNFPDNCLHKINMHAKKLPPDFSHHTGMEAPWFFGAVLITGDKGENIELVRPNPSQPVFLMAELIERIKQPIAKSKNRPVTTEFKSKLTEFLGLILEPKNLSESSFGDFEIVDRERGKKLGWETCLGRHSVLSMQRDFELQLFRRDSVEDPIAAHKALSREYEVLHALRRVPGVPRVLPILRDAEKRQEALPIQVLEGRESFAEWLDSAPSDGEKLTVIQACARILSQAHLNEHFHGDFSGEVLHVLPAGSVQIRGFGKQGGEFEAGKATDAVGLARLAAELLSPSALEHLAAGKGKWDVLQQLAPELLEWMKLVAEGKEPDIFSFDPVLGRADLTPESEDVDEGVLLLQSGEILNDTYRLVRPLGEGGTGAVWEAEHLLGDFPCSIKFPYVGDEDSGIAQSEFQTLARLFHPNIVRVYSCDPVGSTGQLMIVSEFGEMTLREAMQDRNSLERSQCEEWFQGCIHALEYLRKLPEPVVHKDIAPRNIVLSGDMARLIDFNMAHLEAEDIGSPKYQLPAAVERQWDWSSDLYALCLSFYELSEGYPFEDFRPTHDEAFVATSRLFNPRTWGRILDVLRGRIPQEGELYSEFFAFARVGISLETGLPSAFLKKIGLKGNQTPFLMAILLDNGGRLTKKQLIQKTLRWKNMSVSAKHKTSYGAALANMRNDGFLDYPRNVKKKGARVYVDVAPRILESWQAFCS